ncbi:MAG: TonB-dependent receptor [Gammaproteobacteria bacterium]|nr:TonB-dependent receptor [Gammaproteobacteria bacterium]
MKPFSRFGCLSTPALLLWIGGAAAEEVPATDSSSLEEIVVTAQKRAERLQDVPIQVNVFNEQAIADAGIRSTQDFVSYVPNMTFDRADTYRNSFVVIRGLTQITNADSPLAVVVDGVPQNDQKQFNMRLFDIDRIEVLKGPQGTLYGRDAIGGAVNIVTRAPTQELSGFGEVSYGNGSATQATGGLSGPLGSDKVLFRLSADYLTDDGRISNTYRHDKSDYVDYDYTVRGRLNVAPTESLKLDLRGQFGKFKGGTNQYSVVSDNNPNHFVDPRYNIGPISKGDTGELTFKFDQELGFATLTGISGYTKITEVSRADLDFSNPVDNPEGFLGFGFQAGQGQDLDVKLYSQELRLVSATDQRLRWVGGMSYLYTDKALQTRAFIDLDGQIDQINNPALVIVNKRELDRNHAYAGFGQFDFDLLPKLTLTAGARFDHDARDQADPATGTRRRKNFQAWQPKVTLSYKPDEDATIYTTWSTGFRPGGFNAPNVPIPEFREEYLRNIEAGFKSTWWQRRLALNGALFYEQVSNYQYFFVDAASASQIIGNIDRVEVKGVELEAQLRVLPGWQVFANYGLDDSVIKRLAAFAQDVGNHTPRSTEWSGVLGTEYRGALTASLTWFGRADLQLYGKKYWQIDNREVQDPKNYLNLRLGVEGGRWSAYLWGRNVTNTRAYSEYNPQAFSGLNVDIGYLVQPATYGVDARVKF